MKLFLVFGWSHAFLISNFWFWTNANAREITHTHNYHIIIVRIVCKHQTFIAFHTRIGLLSCVELDSMEWGPHLALRMFLFPREISISVAVAEQSKPIRMHCCLRSINQFIVSSVVCRLFTQKTISWLRKTTTVRWFFLQSIIVLFANEWRTDENIERKKKTHSGNN